MDINCLNDTSTLGKFDDPFLLPSNDFIPESMSSALDFCRYLYGLNPEYQQASTRVVSHFVTDFMFKGGTSDENDKLKDFLTYDLKLRHAMLEMGNAWACYGNSFWRVHRPFKRFLVDDRKKGKTLYYDLGNFRLEDINFNVRTKLYTVPDPTKSMEGKIDLKFIDLPSNDKSGLELIQMDPRYVDIIHSELSKKSVYLFRFPERLKSDIKNGNIFQINNAPKPMLDAILDDKDFLFNTDEVFHFRAPSIPGVSDNDWGLPGPIANFRLFYQIQIYRKMDEAVALDYMMPFRVITPEFGTSATDSTVKIAMNRWRPEITKMVQERRKNKFAVFTLPFPVKYEEFGASGKELAPKDLLEYQINNLLNASGYPAQLYTMDLDLKQMPTAIRLFENTFWFMHEGFTEFTRWVTQKISKFLEIGKLDVGLERPSTANNIDKQNVLLQLGMNGEIPRHYFMKNYGIEDPVGAAKERFREDLKIDRHRMEEEESAQREMEAAESMRQQADPAGGDGQGGSTPHDVEEQAMEKAKEWMSMQDGERSKAMQAEKATNFNRYTLAKQYMEEFRAQGEREGRQQVNQQAQQGGG